MLKRLLSLFTRSDSPAAPADEAPHPATDSPAQAGRRSRPRSRRRHHDTDAQSEFPLGESS
ncbi:MAG: hypothetical protein H7067_00005, partial [Burkholderiales bacterium]|nr:hypothetical protein [Opitutaceae bacterium]